MSWNHKSRIVALGVAIQAVAGVFTSPSAADLVPVSPPQNSTEQSTTQDPTATGGVWSAPDIVLGETANISGTAPLRGPGGSEPFAANAWPLGRILQSAGWSESRLATALSGPTTAIGTTTSLPLATASSTVDDFYVGYPLQSTVVSATPGVKSTTAIVDYVGSTKSAVISDTLSAAAPSGTNYTIPACVVYQLGTLAVSPPLLSVSVWRDKVRYDYKDVRVSQLSIDMPVANEQNQVFPSIEFTMRGLRAGKSDVASTPSLTAAMLTAIPPYKNGKFSLNRVPLGHQSMRFSQNMDVAGASNSHPADGQDAYEVMNGARTLDLDLNQMNVTDFDIDALVTDRTPISAVSAWGGGAGNNFLFSAPGVVLNPHSPGDRNGFVNLTGQAAFVEVDKSATLAIWW